MPIKNAAFKHLRQTKKRTAANKAVLDNVGKLLKNSRRLITAKKKDEAKPIVAETVKALAKAAQKGVIKKNTASRTASRLVRSLNALG